MASGIQGRWVLRRRGLPVLFCQGAERGGFAQKPGIFVDTVPHLIIVGIPKNSMG
jgi:hypothetical protein